MEVLYRISKSKTVGKNTCGFTICRKHLLPIYRKYLHISAIIKASLKTKYFEVEKSINF